MAKRLSVVVSQTQSRSPEKRALEEKIVTAFMLEPGIDLTVIPHLYDLSADSTGMLALNGMPGDMIVLSWLYERAAHWVLDRNGIWGKEGQTLITRESEEDEDELDELEDEEEKERVIEQREIPNRSIYCLDLRIHDDAEAYIEEVRRIATERNTEVVELMGWIQGTPKPEQLERYLEPAGEANVIEGDGKRRWYPVIDFGRCTNCMECIDFCLFGVYGVDATDTILVEQPDNCRKGCPACSRVCPENAIIFPQHKSPAIAGSNDVVGGLKIDLSQLFGAPSGEDAVNTAVRERDEQLMLAGREAVGTAVGLPKRQADVDEEKDDLDNLLDELDDLDI